MRKATNPKGYLVPYAQQFYRPTPLLRQLMLLRLLQDDPLQSQAALGKICGLTPAIINKYMDKLCSEDLIKVTPVNKRDMRYAITEKGQLLAGKLLDAYSAEVSRTYAFMRSVLVDRLQELLNGHTLRIGVFGCDATGEILLMALAGFPSAQLVTVVDSDPAKIGKSCLGYIISPPSRLSAVLPDMVIVASWGAKQEIIKAINTLALPDSVRVVTL